MNVVELMLAADVANWRASGLSIADDGTSVLGGIRFRFLDRAQASGLCGWGMAGSGPIPADVDGLPTYAVDAPEPAGPDAHLLGALGVDHIVVATPSLDRTCEAITAATGAPVRRVREVGDMRQAFILPGDLLVEVVSYPAVPAGPATFWGLVLNVADLDATVERLGPDLAGPIKDAVQPGRRISTLRIEAGLGCRVALITPRPPR